MSEQKFGNVNLRLWLRIVAKRIRLAGTGLALTGSEKEPSQKKEMFFLCCLITILFVWSFHRTPD